MLKKWLRARIQVAGGDGYYLTALIMTCLQYNIVLRNEFLALKGASG